MQGPTTAKRTSALFLLLCIALLTGCGPQVDPARIHGDWTYRVTLDPTQTASADNPPPEGVEISTTLEARQTFSPNASYELRTRMTMRIDNQKGTTALKFLIIKRGTWSVDDDLLLETSESAEVEPENPAAAAALQSNPRLAEDLAGGAGDTTVARILEVSDQRLLLLDEESDVSLELVRVGAGD
jgi:hypothetical protein